MSFVLLEELLPAVAQILALNFSFRKDLKSTRYSARSDGYFESLETGQRDDGSSQAEWEDYVDNTAS